jgi:hypothetical protein
MERTLFALPIIDGQTETARAFLRDLESQRRGEYAASEKRLGIQKEVWALQVTPQGALFVIYFECPAVGAAVQQFSASRDAFDVWFKEQIRAATGVDINNLPPGPLSEVLSVYEE